MRSELDCNICIFVNIFFNREVLFRFDCDCNCMTSYTRSEKIKKQKILVFRVSFLLSDCYRPQIDDAMTMSRSKHVNTSIVLLLYENTTSSASHKVIDQFSTLNTEVTCLSLFECARS